MGEEFVSRMYEAIGHPGQPKPALDCLCESYREAVGFDQFTMTCVKFPLEGTKSGYRVFSTNPEVYPLIEVPFTDHLWVEAMLSDKRILVMDSVEEFRPYYKSWVGLRDAGFRSAANQPVIVNDITIGTINLMSRTERYFDLEKVEAAKRLHADAVLAMILCAHARGLAPDLPLCDPSGSAES